MQGADLELGPRVPPLRPSLRRRLGRSEEHTSELQSRLHLVCRLLLEKKKIDHAAQFIVAKNWTNSLETNHSQHPKKLVVRENVETRKPSPNSKPLSTFKTKTTHMKCM